MSGSMGNAILAARAAVRRKATGMTREQVTDATEAARMYERMVNKTDDGYPMRHKVAENEHREWRRIGHVMDETCGMDVYDPASDPQVARWKAADAERAETGGAR